MKALEKKKVSKKSNKKYWNEEGKAGEGHDQVLRSSLEKNLGCI